MTAPAINEVDGIENASPFRHIQLNIDVARDVSCPIRRLLFDELLVSGGKALKAGWADSLPQTTPQFSAIVTSLNGVDGSGSIAGVDATLFAQIEYLAMLVAIDFRHWAADPSDKGVKAGDRVRVKQFFAPPLDSATPAPRGSQAATALLKRAAEKGIGWFTPAFLLREAYVVRKDLEDIMTGVEADLKTPLVIPSLTDRIVVLRDIANNLQRNKSSFSRMLLECGGKLCTDGPSDASKGFIDALIKTSSRYNDGVTLGTGKRVAMNKLAQLTAVALHSALGDKTPLVTFFDWGKINVCADYQLPRALRAAGVLLYDDHLSRLVDEQRLLERNGMEEVELRASCLAAADELMRVFLSDAVREEELAKAPGKTFAPLTADILDYALWCFGRDRVANQPHHLCITTMY